MMGNRSPYYRLISSSELNPEETRDGKDHIVVIPSSGAALEPKEMVDALIVGRLMAKTAPTNAPAPSNVGSALKQRILQREIGDGIVEENDNPVLKGL